MITEITGYDNIIPSAQPKAIQFLETTQKRATPIPPLVKQFSGTKEKHVRPTSIRLSSNGNVYSLKYSEKLKKKKKLKAAIFLSRYRPNKRNWAIGAGIFTFIDCTKAELYLYGQELRNFIENLQAVGGIRSISRELVHLVHFLVNLLCISVFDE